MQIKPVRLLHPKLTLLASAYPYRVNELLQGSVHKMPMREIGQAGLGHQQ